MSYYGECFILTLPDKTTLLSIYIFSFKKEYTKEMLLKLQTYLIDNNTSSRGYFNMVFC